MKTTREEIATKIAAMSPEELVDYIWEIETVSDYYYMMYPHKCRIIDELRAESA